MMDTFGTGLLVGLIVAAPVFASARLAIGLIGSTAAGIAPFVITNGFDSFKTALGALVESLTRQSHLTVGLLLGVACAGVLSMVFRWFATWR